MGGQGRAGVSIMLVPCPLGAPEPCMHEDRARQTAQPGCACTCQLYIAAPRRSEPGTVILHSKGVGLQVLHVM
jgi:hypothetical protein